MKINAKAVQRQLKPKGALRGPVTVYLDRELFKRFRKACGEHSASETIEEMIRQYLASK